MMRPFRRVLKNLSTMLLAVFFAAQVQAAPAAPQGNAEAGKAVFEANCASCHKLKGKLIGPHLKGVVDRWPDYNKLIDFVQHPSNYIGKDPYINKLQAEANGAIMAVGALTPQQAADAVAYANVDGVPGGGGKEGPGGAVSFNPVPSTAPGMRILALGILLLLLVISYLAFRIRGTLSRDKDKIVPGDEDRPARKYTAIHKINGIIFPIFIILAAYGLYYDFSAHLGYLRPRAASDIGEQIDRLFNNTLIITAIVFVVTHLLLFYYLFRYRGRAGRKGYYYPHNNTVEVIWTAIPAIVLAFLVLDGFRTWTKATSNPENKPLTIEAFAKQFDWTLRYPGADGVLGRVDFRLISADNPVGLDFTDKNAQDDYLVTDTMYLPKGRDLYIKARSQDVTHAVYFPHFRMQIYAQPGMDNRLRFVPTVTTAEMQAEIKDQKFHYELACNQLCGAAHWNMRRVVKVVTDTEYAKWDKNAKHVPAFKSYKGATAGSTAMNH